MKHSKFRLVVFIPVLCFVLCNDKPQPNKEMIQLLRVANEYDYDPKNIFAPEANMEFYDSIINISLNQEQLLNAWYGKAEALLQLGEELKAIEIYEKLFKKTSVINFDKRTLIMKDLAAAYLRLGERTNCIHNHSAESCIFPITVRGVHRDKTGSEKAIEIYSNLLFENPNDLESKWLMNIAYMTVGKYPTQVPPAFLIKLNNEDSMHTIKPFTDVAANVGLNLKDMAGGSIVEDFNNDGYLDVIKSSWDLTEHMHYCKNNGNGTFTDMSEYSGLSYLTGGSNIMQTDYNNDGFKDIFVLRGGWRGKFGKHPNSLLRNNGDDTFTDVTKEAGLLSFYPTMTATWADFNNDGWLDVFIGNETNPSLDDINTCELYVNNKTGTFAKQSSKSGSAINEFVKGVTSGDYDNDGRTDIFISTLNGKKILLKNETITNGEVKFSDVSKAAGLSNFMGRTFPTWFWDYDNDGWLDIFVSGYEFNEPLAYYAAAEATQTPIGPISKMFLFRNKRDGTFEEISAQAGLSKISFAMGANFGDIDNDGYLDFYLGTGNPKLKSLIPNKLFKNLNGAYFMDVTTSARVGNLQKGHGVSFADMDNDGDEDIYIELGGAYVGDAYENSFYLNPGQNNNHWLNISLEGIVSNKAAIGAKISVAFKEGNAARAVYRDVNSGGSFGSNPLRQHVGIGQANVIDKLEISWPTTNKTQVFRNIPVDINIKIKEGDDKYTAYTLDHCDFHAIKAGLIPCPPKK